MTTLWRTEAHTGDISRSGVQIPPAPYHILNFLSSAYIYLLDRLHHFWADLRGEQDTDRTTKENDARLRTTPGTLWFGFDEESFNKTVTGTPPITTRTSQGCYSPDSASPTRSGWMGVPRERSSSSFCEEPDRLLTTVCVREEGEKNHPGSHRVPSGSTTRWVK